MRTHDSLWKYDKGDYAVVDMGLDEDDLWTKFAGTPSGIREKNVAGKGTGVPRSALLSAAVVNRFAGALGVFALVGLVLWRWRGSRAFTVRCVKCGTPFCKHCHLGQTAVGLCSQCHHLFVVRDGVSGPARNQKLLEVQKEDERRGRIFRLLSIVSPGAGHVYAQRVLVGFLIVFFWYAVIALTVLGGRFLPFTEVSGTVARPLSSSPATTRSGPRTRTSCRSGKSTLKPSARPARPPALSWPSMEPTIGEYGPC